jgi:hypothetical protein
MRLASAGMLGRWHAPVSEPRRLVFDLAGERIEVPAADARRLQAAAVRRAGASTRSRDIGLLLDRGLRTGGVVALRRAEAATLERLALEADLGGLAERLAAPGRRKPRS